MIVSKSRYGYADVGFDGILVLYFKLQLAAKQAIEMMFHILGVSS
jgi:hypothetical protein